MKWICKMLQRIKAQDEEFETRIRAEKAGEERRFSTVSAGRAAVLVRVLRRAG